MPNICYKLSELSGSPVNSATSAFRPNSSRSSSPEEFKSNDPNFSSTGSTTSDGFVTNFQPLSLLALPTEQKIQVSSSSLSPKSTSNSSRSNSPAEHFALIESRISPTLTASVSSSSIEPNNVRQSPTQQFSSSSSSTVQGRVSPTAAGSHSSITVYYGIKIPADEKLLNNHRAELKAIGADDATIDQIIQEEKLRLTAKLPSPTQPISSTASLAIEGRVSPTAAGSKFHYGLQSANVVQNTATPTSPTQNPSKCIIM